MWHSIYKKYKKYWFLPGTFIFVVSFAVVILGIYRNTLEDIKQDHQIQQLEMTRTAAQGIMFFINHISSDIRLLASNAEIKKMNNSSLSFLKQYLPGSDLKIIQSVFLTDKNLNAIGSAGGSYPQWAYNYTRQVILSSGNKSGLFVSPVSTEDTLRPDSELLFQMIVPVTDNSTLTDTIGYVGYLINFNGLIDQFIKPLKLGKNDYAWVIDGMGRLIYHPRHNEMLLHSINTTSKQCYECHKSFSVQNSIIRADSSSVGEYTITENEPPKIMAYFPIKLDSQKWILVISTLVSQVTENLRDRFRVFFIIGFVILGLLIAFSFLIYNINAKRIRAEEARRNLEQMQQFQEQLNRTSRLASIGELVDSVAHEINTPAGIIAAHVDGLLLSNRFTESLGPTLNIIKKQTQRISEYTHTLLNYSRRMPFNPEAVSLNRIISECLYLLGHRFRSKNISIVKKIGAGVPSIYADPRQMEQVFLNIFNNAIDAVDNSGEIIVSLNYPEKAEGKNVSVIIEDNGIGIPEENLGKVFNPFFSTKPEAAGTGLGLSIVQAIIKRHNGKISIVSKPGKGTLVKITLPAELGEKEGQ